LLEYSKISERLTKTYLKMRVSLSVDRFIVVI
jgi:hypothetical protein